jgi:flagellar motor switch protein FliN/FliY
MDLEERPSTARRRADNLRLLENIDVRLTVEVGATTLKIRDLIRLNEGSVIELNRLAGEQLEVFVNGANIARGEVVMVGERLGIRFTEIITPEMRLQNL